MEQKNENYQSMETSYYESTGTTPTMTMQRKLGAELTRYHDGSSVVKLAIKDYLTNYEWTGTLEDLINQLTRSTKNESMSEM